MPSSHKDFFHQQRFAQFGRLAVKLKRPSAQAWRSIVAALCIVTVGSAQALSLAVEQGAITGVLGIEIHGRLYDVTFVNGSFNGTFPAELNGYGDLARDAAQALRLASDRGALRADPNWRPGLKLRGCTSDQSCTILIPSRSTAAAPAAQTTYALEVIYSDEQFRPMMDKLWPFDAATDTTYMPDMLFAVLTPAGARQRRLPR